MAMLNPPVDTTMSFDPSKPNLVCDSVNDTRQVPRKMFPKHFAVLTSWQVPC